MSNCLKTTSSAVKEAALAGFTDIKVTDIREHVWPTMRYLHDIAIVPFLILSRHPANKSYAS
jgi:hypothetical protein